MARSYQVTRDNKGNQTVKVYEGGKVISTENIPYNPSNSSGGSSNFKRVDVEQLARDDPNFGGTIETETEILADDSSFKPPTAIYDNVNKQSRALTEFEQTAQTQVFQSRQQSILNPVAGGDFFQTRTALLSDPKTERVYISSTKAGTSIIGADIQAEPIKAPEPSKGLYSGGEGYGGSITADKSRNLKGNIFNTIGGLKSFKQGFLFQGDEFGGDPRYTKPFTYQAGNVLGLATLSERFWTPVGTGASNLLYRSPTATKFVIKGMNILQKPGLRVAQKQLIGAYAFTTGVKSYQAYKTEGSPGSSRVLLNAFRPVMALGVTGQAFNKQLVSNVKSNVYEYVGPTKAYTEFNKGSGRFDSNIKREGLLLEKTLPKFGGKTFNKYYLKESASFQGLSKGDEIAGIAFSKGSVYNYPKKGKALTKFNDVSLFRGDVSTSAKLIGGSEALASSVSPSSASPLMLDSYVGAGRSRFRFTQSNLYRQTKGAGTLDFTFLKSDPMSGIKGDLFVRAGKFTTKGSFTENILYVQGGAGAGVLSGGSSSIMPSGRTNIQSIASGLTFNRGVTSVPVLESPMLLFSKPSSSLDPLSGGGGRTGSTLKLVSAFGPTSTPQNVSSSYGLTGELVETRGGLLSVGRTGPKVGGVADNTFLGDVITDPAVGSMAVTRPSVGVGAVPSVSSPIVPPGLFGGGFRPGRPVKPVPIIPVPGLPSFNIPKPRKGKGSSFSLNKGSFKDIYTPSLEAGLFNVKSEKKPDDLRFRSGITLRPLVSGGVF